ncbi:Transporter [Roseomonas mucosa]|uniref:Putative inner membrane protein n=1 Tax=Roseomonas mucosa TaxID=207340 RepID=A0A379MXL2_9PROT|nr:MULTISPECIES: YeeE/YedE family protein [Roseomonas]MBS5904421.1 YeeE/YedE family protein [Acetobacteraceae bacterium]MCG7352244.1 YeeE/YedE family protein [Roseomonas mucosa]MCG7357524.1 YeeE/YedE family protein [Roseomonas mucosa]MDT8291665.1 YeeE/YedE family protein [Roseomonas mucosa]MDT8293012.1 YeeE/YedE family protein [Roseomonas mucosa]
MSATTLAPSAGLGIQRPAALLAGAALLLGALLIGQAVSPHQALLYLLGAALGLVLYHAAFGFTSAWRVFIADRRGEGLRAQMVMLALATVLFFPVLASGSLFGQPVSGLVSPAGTSVVVGAFLFGIGMQMGGGCASGTLYTVGGGSMRMVITLAAFIAGSAIGAAHLHWWAALPSLPRLSIVQLWGPWAAMAVQLAAFAAIAAVTVVLERRRHGVLATRPAAPRQGLARFIRGPWPLLAGAVALALLNFATLALAGRPWGITSAFALWGSKAALALGFGVDAWPFWSTPAAQAQLHGSVLADVTSVMDFGIILGALLAAALAGRFAPTWRVPLRSALAAVVGGLLLGYGARLAYGCNIGAYFSGIASGSLHGWVWLVAAFAGNVLGTRLRPLFGLEVERTPRLTGC